MDQPILVPIPDKKLYLLIADYEFKFEDYYFFIRKGFAYDGASIPFIAWQAVGTPFDPEFMLPAMVHDWIYITHKYTREEADDLLRILLIANGVSESKAFTMWSAVRTFGWAGWDNSEKKLKEMKELHSQEQIEKYLYQFQPVMS